MTTEATEPEKRAAEIVYKRDSGLAVGFNEIPDEDCQRILKEIRTRVLLIEQHVTHDMLDRKLSEGRWTPRRQIIVAFVFGLILLVVIFGLLGIESLFTHL